MSDSEATTDLPPDASSRAEGRFRAMEGILQTLRRGERMQAGGKALSRLRAEAESPSALAQVGERPSGPYVRELMRRCVTGQLGPLELDALQILMRCDPQAQAELERVCEELGQPVPSIAQDRAPLPMAAPGAPVHVPGRKPSTRRQFAPALPAGDRGFRFGQSWLVAAAFLVALTGGLLWLWIAQAPSSTPRVSKVDDEAAERRRELSRRLAELERETEELAAAQRTVRRLPRPVPAPPEAKDEPAKTEPAPLLDERELARRREEAEKCARLLDMRRLLLETELAGLRKPKPPAQSDEEPDESVRVAVAPEAPEPEVGRVVYVEREAGKAVLVRGEGGGKKPGARVELAAGTKLLRGDRIEVARGGEEACASLELRSGTTIDVAATTSVRVLDRDAVRLETGKIYAHVAPTLPGDQDPEYAVPFSLQTSAANYILQEASVEVVASPPISKPWTSARVDAGAVHVFNDRGHAMGHKGQEVSASVHGSPTRSDGFRAPIWRGRNRPHPGLPFGKGHPLVLSDEDTQRSFSAEYALALSHTGEIDLRGIQVTHGGPASDPQALWRDLKQEVSILRKGGLRGAVEPQLGATRMLQRPASGRCEDTTPERSKAVDQLLAAARTASPDRPLVVVASGSLTDLASAWLLDRSVSKRTVVVTRTVAASWNQDAWASTIVLEQYLCVICNVGFPADDLPLARLEGTRWDFLAVRARNGNTDFSQFASVTVPGFVQATERARFIRGKTGNPSDFRFEPDPKGRTWLVKRADALRMAREFEATFMTGSGAR